MILVIFIGLSTNTMIFEILVGLSTNTMIIVILIGLSINTMILVILIGLSTNNTMILKFVGRTSRGHTGGSHRISHPPSFCGACLNFSREKDSAIPFPRRL